MTQPADPTPSIEVQPSFLDLFALEEHARGLIVAPLHRLRLNPIINFSSYRKWMLIFYILADPISFYLSMIFDSDSWFHRKSTKTTSLMVAIFLNFLALYFSFIISLAVLINAGEIINNSSGAAQPGGNSMPLWLFWTLFLILLVFAGAQVINWGRFILNKKSFVLRIFVFALFLLAIHLLPRIYNPLEWLMRIFTTDNLGQLRLGYLFFILLIFAALSFLFWFVTKTIFWGLMLVYYLSLNILQLTKTAIFGEIQHLLKPVQLKEGKVFSLDVLQPAQLRSVQEWTKNRMEAINYRFVAIGAFLTLFTLFTTSSTAQGWVDKVLNLLMKFLILEEELKFGEQFLALALMLVIIGFVTLFYNYWHGILALNLIREACILVQFNNPPAPQPQPEQAAGGPTQPWFNASLIFLLTSLVILFTSIIKDRRSK